MTKDAEEEDPLRQDYPDFTISLEVKDDDFAPAPSDFQREWTLGRALHEFGDDLRHLDGVVRGFVPGVERPAITQRWHDSHAAVDDAELIIQGQQVMQAWERPLMKRMAEAAAESHGDVLEIGFGMGISATFIQEAGVRSYTVVEANDAVAEQFERWREGYPGRDIRLVKGLWQEVEDQLGLYDGILFDTYPLSQEEYLRNEVEGTAYTHASEFFPVAARHLREGGVFTHFTCEIDTLSRGHQRRLLEQFDSFAVSVVRGLEPPESCQYWWADSMVVVKAYKGKL